MYWVQNVQFLMRVKKDFAIKMKFNIFNNIQSKHKKNLLI